MVFCTKYLNFYQKHPTLLVPMYLLFHCHHLFPFLLNGIQSFSFLAFSIPKTWLVVKAEIQTTRYWHLNEFKQPVVTSFFYTMCIHFSGNINSVWIIITSLYMRAPIVCYCKQTLTIWIKDGVNNLRSLNTQKYFEMYMKFVMDLWPWCTQGHYKLPTHVDEHCMYVR